MAETNLSLNNLTTSPGAREPEARPVFTPFLLTPTAGTGGYAMVTVADLGPSRRRPLQRAAGEENFGAEMPFLLDFV